MALNLSSEQMLAVERLIQFYGESSNPYFVMHGLAGTGKTTVLSHLARIYPKAMLCHPHRKSSVNPAPQDRVGCNDNSLGILPA